MRLDEYARYDATGLAELVRRKEVRAIELKDLAFKGIEMLNPTLNFISGFSRSEAVSADIERASSRVGAPFAGVPFLMKESHGRKGLSQSGSSRLGEGLIAKADNHYTQRLRSTGVVTLGSTNMPEFGSSATTEPVLNGPTRNPWDLTRMTGGSSGGAAAAVAAGVVPMAQSSDGGGSIRIPAHCCGNFGLKPTSGRTPAGPFSFGGLFNFGQTHVNTRSVRDSAAFLGATHGSEAGGRLHLPLPERPYLEEVGRSPGQLRIAYTTESVSDEPVDAECVAAVEGAARLCDDLGHKVEDSHLPYDFDTFLDGFFKIWAANLHSWASAVAADTGRTPGPKTLETSTLAFYELGASLTGPEIYQALERLHKAQLGIDRFFSDHDVFLSPVTLKPALALGTMDANAPGISAEEWFDQALSKFAAFTPVYNATGQPAMSVPLHHSKDGLPVGVQFAARHCDESTLFRLAAQLEEACPWIDRHPTHSLFGSGHEAG